MIAKIKEWSCDNKLLVFFILTSLCLFVSTVTISAQKRAQCDQKLIDKLFDGGGGGQKAGFANIAQEQNYYRLSRHVIPKNYKLLLKPHKSNKTFDGSVTITVMVLEPTRTIMLHSNNLTIHGVFMEDINNQTVLVSSTNTTSDKREFLNINLAHELSKQYYKLHLTFSGTLDKKIVGFYASNLKNGGTMIASKFQPTYARQAFPCFDEPDLKSTFDITLWKPTSLIALSNMNEISSTYDETANMDKVTFATSVRMSTYLVCFVICDFDHKEVEINTGGIGENFKLRLYAQKNELHKIDFAQDIAKRATEFYIKYYNVAYPLPKLDMIAIPDYVSGATEHWGLITYRETSFLVDKAKASTLNKLAVANTIAHELAHMWFGNLVTTFWWSEVWLNEGFATYMQVKALNALEPAWSPLDHFVTTTVQPVLKIDAQISSHPVLQTVYNPDQITEIFDSITYNKGAAILRMLEGILGEENFRLAMSEYLKTQKFKSTSTDSLMSYLEPYFITEDPSLDITKVMSSWIQQAGYPLLRVLPGKNNVFTVQQTFFLQDPRTKIEVVGGRFNRSWFVPITYKTDSGVSPKIVWSYGMDAEVEITLKDEWTWIKLNNDQVGYYRVLYPMYMWDLLLKEMKTKSGKLTISDRCNLLDDAFALANSENMPYRIALKLSDFLSVEEDYEPWSTAAVIFNELATRLLNSKAYGKLQKYVRRLITPLYEKQNWDSDELGVIESLLRVKVISLAVRFDVPDAKSRVRTLFLDWLKSHGTPEHVPIKPDLRDIVYYYGIKSATPEEWDQLWEIYQKEDDAQEKTKLRNALAASGDVDILKKYLLLAWDETKIRSQDYLGVLQHISANPAGTAIVWDHVRSNWPQLVERFSLNSRYLGNLVPAITATFNTKLQLNEMEAFFEQYRKAGAGESARKRALDTVRYNIHWKVHNEKAVSDWLAKNCDALLDA